MIDGRRGRKRAQAQAAAPVTTRSFGERLVALGVGANTVTAIGVLLAAATGVLIGLGYFLVAVALIIVGGLMDTLDGHLAKVAGTASARGAFFDSVSDRVGDSLIFIGVAWYFVRTHDADAALLPLAILALANLVSYERAKAESLGYKAQGGLMERAERLILLGVSLFIAYFVHASLVPLLGLLAVLTAATASGRFVRVWRQASGIASTRISPTRALIERRRQAWLQGPRADRQRRNRRELMPLSVRLRTVFSAQQEQKGAQRHERVKLRRSAHAFMRRIDIDR
jgi:CDP-diacylglycerol---glycerol-3-phosphate 3-phosphatidyltransferase